MPFRELWLLLACEPWAKLAKEAGILKVEQNGSETCELFSGSSFVSVRVPIRIEGEGQRSEAVFHYSVGSFCGRDTPLALGPGLETTLRFRIPKEFLRSGELFTVEALADAPAGTQKVLWARRWRVVWQGTAPALEPIAEESESFPVV